MAYPYIKKESKYHNKPVVIDGIKFDSSGEGRRFCYLRLLEQAGEIKNLEYHKLFELIPPIRKEIQVRMKNGTTYTRVTNEPRCYEADFTYTIVATGEQVVEDFKGVETDLFLFKKDLFLSKYGIEIKIVKHVNEPVH